MIRRLELASQCERVTAARKKEDQEGERQQTENSMHEKIVKEKGGR